MTLSRRERWRRLALRALAGLFAFLAIVFCGLWAALHLLAPQKIKGMIEGSTSAYLGRQLTIESVATAPFPRLELLARNVELSDKQGRVIVKCGGVSARASLTAIFKLRLGAEDIRFEKPEISLWYEKDGRLNVEHIVREIGARPKTPGRRSVGSLLLHRFSVEEGRLTLADVPGAPPVIDGRADGQITLTFSPMGLRGTPYELSVDEGDDGAQLYATGAFGAFPKLHLRVKRLPARALAPRLDEIGNCSGAADARIDWAGGPKPSLDFSVSPAGLCGEAKDFPERVSGTLRRARGAWTLEAQASGGETKIAAKGKIPAAPRPMSFAVAGEKADAEAIFGWSKTAAALRPRAARVAPSTAPVREIGVTVRLASATWKNLRATNVAFELRRSTDSRVRIAPASMDIFGGRAEGTLEVRDGFVIVPELRGNGLSIGDINAAFSSTAALTGLMSLSLDGHSPIGAPVISSFTGQAEIWVENFELERVPTILKVLTSANFNKIERALKGEKKDPFPPAKGGAKADLNNGKAYVNRLVLDNRVLRIGYTGDIRYVDKTLDGIMVVQTLTAADQLIKNIPLVRDLVLGDGKSFLPLWFRMTGPIHDPKVRAMPARSLATPVWDIFKRVLDLPQDALDKLRGK